MSSWENDMSVHMVMVVDHVILYYTILYYTILY